MDREVEKRVVDAFDALYVAVRRVSEGTASQDDMKSLAALRDAFLDAFAALPNGTDISSVLDLDSVYGLMDMLSGGMDMIASEGNTDEPGWDRFMDIIRDAVEV